MTINLDPGSSIPASEKPLRYGKLPEIHHIFKSDPKSPPKIITVVFAAAVIAALPVLLGAVSTSHIHAYTSLANQVFSLLSGSHSVPISTISPKLSVALRFRMRCSSAPSWLWRVFSLCTIRLGTCSRHCRQLLA